MEIEKWFKTKKYPHIGLPIKIKDYNWVKDYVENFEKVRIHSFLPLIHKVILKRRFRADKDILERNVSHKRKRKLGKPKTRHIFYASHLDSLILSKYNEILATEYEKYVENLNFNESVVAYRKIPLSKGSKKKKCNIDFAKTTFEFIQSNNSKKLTVIVADVTEYFDNLNHKILKKQWSKVLKTTTLPKDHYNVFKALTNIKYIEGDKLFESYGNTMMVKKGIPNSLHKTEFVRKQIKNIKFFKEKEASHYCDKKEFLKNKTFYGNEIVANTRRMCLMNMYLHNIGEIDGDTPIKSTDALIADDGLRVDYVLANPPFGKKSSITITNEQGDAEKQDMSYNRQDFWETTSNKQLNFLQHIKTQLKIEGEAAVVLPDNVLFEGGAGEEVRKQLMKTANLHTILRLPTGIFYAQGVKANVLFFTNKPASKEAWTKEVWFYDYRTNVHHTPKKNPMQFEHLKEFIELYNGSNINKRQETWSEENPDGRWRKYSYEDIIARDKTSLDVFWLKDKSLTDLDNLPDPDILASEIIENIEAGLNSFKEIMETINGVGE
jgi:hypothetical protein